MHAAAGLPLGRAHSQLQLVHMLTCSWAQAHSVLAASKVLTSWLAIISWLSPFSSLPKAGPLMLWLHADT